VSKILLPGDPCAPAALALLRRLRAHPEDPKPYITYSRTRVGETFIDSVAVRSTVLVACWERAGEDKPWKATVAYVLRHGALWKIGHSQIGKELNDRAQSATH
jgi:hypothetical protein